MRIVDTCYDVTLDGVISGRCDQCAIHDVCEDKEDRDGVCEDWEMGDNVDPRIKKLIGEIWSIWW